MSNQNSDRYWLLNKDRWIYDKIKAPIVAT